ncbi:hypothetical protein HYFRA_00006917 [Hymenoscyphus fraxineus]|uniref:Uncharacterized protein n=1 Tax=Hymenoscyphus fraxineus TaxID=746836 RepID=A0A9N9PP94_9HELO|nr:hypothetical protein HYFRA_00006917 [Hymenoscyphus fraxineus]
MVTDLEDNRKARPYFFLPRRCKLKNYDAPRAKRLYFVDDAENLVLRNFRKVCHFILSPRLKKLRRGIVYETPKKAIPASQWGFIAPGKFDLIDAPPGFSAGNRSGTCCASTGTHGEAQNAQRSLLEESVDHDGISYGAEIVVLLRTVRRPHLAARQDPTFLGLTLHHQHSRPSYLSIWCIPTTRARRTPTRQNHRPHNWLSSQPPLSPPLFTHCTEVVICSASQFELHCFQLACMASSGPAGHQGHIYVKPPPLSDSDSDGALGWHIHLFASMTPFASIIHATTTNHHGQAACATSFNSLRLTFHFRCSAQSSQSFSLAEAVHARLLPQFRFFFSRDPSLLRQCHRASKNIHTSSCRLKHRDTAGSVEKARH